MTHELMPYTVWDQREAWAPHFDRISGRIRIWQIAAIKTRYYFGSEIDDVTWSRDPCDWTGWGSREVDG